MPPYEKMLWTCQFIIYNSLIFFPHAFVRGQNLFNIFTIKTKQHKNGIIETVFAIE